MKKLRTVKYALLFTLIALAFCIDRVTKTLALKYLQSAEPISIIPDFLYLQLAFNKGIAFGMLAKYSAFLTIFITFILILAFLYLPDLKKRYYSLAGLVLGGALGNLYDRLLSSQGVIDMLSIPQFAIFNFADIAISTGILLSIIVLMRDDTYTRKA